MKKLKAALHVFYKSLTSPSYYADVIKVNFKFSLKYFAVLVVLATAITFPTSVLPTMMGFKEGLADYETHVLEMYPDDLVVTMTEGRLSINQPEPYIVPLPEDQKGVYLKSETGVDMSDIENLVVINSQGTIDGLDEHKSLVLINSKNILIRSNNKIEVYPLSEFPDGELTQDSVKDMLEKVRPVVDTLPYIVMIMTM